MKPSAAIGASALGVIALLGCVTPPDSTGSPAGNPPSPSVAPGPSPPAPAEPRAAVGVAGAGLRQIAAGRGGGGDAGVRPLGRRSVATAGFPVWEYRVVTLSELLRGSTRQYRNIEKNLNVLGADGWELAYGTSDFFVFKRPAD